MTLASWAQDEVLAPIIANRTHSDRDQTIVIISSTKTFSCSVCGSEAYFCLIGPTKEFRMHDYRLDEREHPERHPRPPSG